MLIVRNVQMAVFADRAWKDFEFSASELLLDQYEEQWHEVVPEVRRRRVSWSLAQGYALGLTGSDDLLLYAGCLIAYGPYFPCHPVIASTLGGHAGTLAGRLRRLYGVPHYVWREMDLLQSEQDWLVVDRGGAAKKAGDAQ